MTLRAQVTIPRNTNLPKDITTNVFHFGGTGLIDDAANLDKIVTVLQSFYSNLRDIYSNEVRFDLARVKIYEMGDPTPRQPLRDVPLVTTGNNNDDGLPSEVAAVISWKAHPAGTIPAARLRGRTYVGPLSRSIGSAGNRDLIDTTRLVQLATSGRALIEDALAQAIPLVVWSAKDYTDPKGVVHPKKPPQATNMAHLVFTGFVDNAFDTQRRRGKTSTNRLVIGPVPGA